MKKKIGSEGMLMIVACIMGLSIFAMSGCMTVQEVINNIQNLDGTNAVQVITNLPPAVTNLPPVSITNLPPVASSNYAHECGCDLSLPRCNEDIRVIYDRANGAGSHQGAGNNEVCWSAQSGQGYDIRCLFRSTHPRQRHVSSWGRKYGYDVVSKGVLDAKCFRQTLSGTTYQNHYRGWADEEDQIIERPDDRRIICKGRTFAFWDVYVVSNSPTSPVIPPVSDPPVIGDIPVPPRTGANSYTGNGANGTFREIPNSVSWNPSKSIVIQSWVKINSWPRTDVGMSAINKGSVGSNWAYGMVIKPDAILYIQTKGSVIARYNWSKGTWHHVRIDATKQGVSFWVDGKNIPTTTAEVSTFISGNEYPVRIGGHSMHWSPPSAWFNASLDGEMSDWSVEVK